MLFNLAVVCSFALWWDPAGLVAAGVEMCSRLVTRRVGVGVPPMAGRVSESLRRVHVLLLHVSVFVLAC